MDPAILSCGEALIDFIPEPLAVTAGAPEAEQQRGYRPCLGGSPYNVARALGRLGVPTGFLSAISTDFFGDQLMAGLTQSRVTADFVQRLEAPSTLGFVSLDRDEPAYAFYDNGAADRSWTSAAGMALPGSAALLHFGSLSLIREPAASAYEALLQREAGGRRLVSLDPNIRPTLVGNEAVYRARLAHMIAAADILKISMADLDWLLPGKTPDDVARDWFANGRASVVVITRGSEGVIGWTRGARAHAAPIPTAVVDTVGAGDSFMAGFLAGLHDAGALSPDALRALSESALQAALHLGQQVASATCRKRGADAPWRHELAAG